MRFVFLALILAAVLATPVFADSMIDFADGSACAVHKVDFGARQVDCIGSDDVLKERWVCEYELEYSCRNEMTGEHRNAGLVFSAKGLCNALCTVGKSTN